MIDLNGEWFSNLADARVRVDDTGGDMILEFWNGSSTAFVGPRQQAERLVELGYWVRWENEEGPTEAPMQDTREALLDQLVGVETDLATLRRMIDDL